MYEKYARYLLEKTQKDYNRIAGHFSKTRGYLWKDLERFGRLIVAGERVLDLGCGNGRLLELFTGKNIDYIGVDNSERLIEIAKKNLTFNVKGVKVSRFVVADALNLPFEDNFFDKVFGIAVFHHIPSKNFRLKFLKEAKRVLKPGGFLILTVWNLYQRRYLKYLLKYFFLKLVGRSELDFKDIFYPWKSPDGKILAQRYIHCFTKQELKGLIRKVGFNLKEIGFLDKNKKNIYAVVENSL